MKIKTSITIITFASLILFAACQEGDKIITADQLPAAAKTYIEQNYPNEHILYVKKDAELFKTDYKVQMSGGLELEFNKNGEIKDIEIDD